jgi:hypothetical protein
VLKKISRGGPYSEASGSSASNSDRNVDDRLQGFELRAVAGNDAVIEIGNALGGD